MCAHQPSLFDRPPQAVPQAGSLATRTSVADRLEDALREIARLVEGGASRSAIVVEDAAIRVHVQMQRFDRAQVWADRARVKLEKQL